MLMLLIQLIWCKGNHLLRYLGFACLSFFHRANAQKWEYDYGRYEVRKCSIVPSTRAAAAVRTSASLA
jgi:hypothetical protein